jgi:prepilin peptidase CpaA
MIGAFLGPWGVLSATVLTFTAGGVLAIAVALRNRALGRTLNNVKTMLAGSLVSAAALGKAEVAAPVVSAGMLPYGVAIAVGTVTHFVMSFIHIEIF